MAFGRCRKASSSTFASKWKSGGTSGTKDGLAVGHDGLRAVVFKVRGEDDDLVAGIREREDRVDHGLGRADRDDDLGLGVERPAHEAAALFAHGAAEIRRAHRDRVLVRAGVADHLEPVHERLGRVEVGEALGEVDGVVRNRDAGHPADDGVGEELAFSAGRLHNFPSFSY
jgi:hypothetical protein